MPIRPKRWVLLAVVVLAALGFFLPPYLNLKRSFQARIVHSMEQAIGRKITVGDIRLRLLPQPGFDLYSLVIAEDPAYGAEPMLRADEVTATLRLSSLWSRRLELASLSLKSGADISPPSLNLVRGPDGHWNIESLLLRASRTPSAPTALKKAEARPRFPYIEASGGRINFKVGQEKKVYVLSDSDFSLWLASEDEWRFRLAARPVRTDFNMNDTGMLKVDGRFRRAQALRDTPLDLSIVLQNTQLGAFTTLVYGRDRGWRGSLDGRVTLVGTPAALNISSRLTVGDFRRYDINAIDPLLLQAQCTARYSSIGAQLSDIHCQMPLEHGLILAQGEVQGPFPAQSYNLSLTAQGVDTQTVVILARHVKKDLPDDLSARGRIDFDFKVNKTPASADETWSGSGHSSALVLSSSVLKPDLALPSLGFAFDNSSPARHQTKPSKKSGHAGPPQNSENPALHLAVAPFRLPAGASTPATVSARFGQQDYQVRLQGDARAQRLLQIGRALGLPVSSSDADGPIRVDFQIAGNWTGFAPPVITGGAQLHEVSARVYGLNFPLQIAGAELQLDRDTATLRHVTVKFPGSSLQLAGLMHLPRNCSSVERCPLAFDLQSDQLSLDALNELLNPQLVKRPWYDVFSSRSPGAVPMRVRANGHLRVNSLLIQPLVARKVAMEVNLDSGKLRLNEISANVLGGTHRGAWSADFTGKEPNYSGTGTFSGIDMLQLAGLMQDNWAAGKSRSTYHLTLSGSSAGQLAASLTGTASFDWQRGVLRHLILDGRSGPLQFKDFSGTVAVGSRSLALMPSTMTTSAGVYQIGGTASLDRRLGITFRNKAHVYELSGSLEKPKINVTPAATRAALQRP